MSGILSTIYAIDSDTSSDDDTSDKLSRRYSIILLIAFCAVVSTKEYVGDPINCWVSYFAVCSVEARSEHHVTSGVWCLLRNSNVIHKMIVPVTLWL